MVEYLRRHGTTLRRLDEQAFESQHHSFKEFVKKRRIPRGVKLRVPTPRHEHRYEIMRRVTGGNRRDKPAIDEESKTSAIVIPPKAICICLSSLCSSSFLCGSFGIVGVCD